MVRVYIEETWKICGKKKCIYSIFTFLIKINNIYKYMTRQAFQWTCTTECLHLLYCESSTSAAQQQPQSLSMSNTRSLLSRAQVLKKQNKFKRVPWVLFVHIRRESVCVQSRQRKWSAYLFRQPFCTWDGCLKTWLKHVQYTVCSLDAAKLYPDSHLCRASYVHIFTISPMIFLSENVLYKFVMREQSL